VIPKKSEPKDVNRKQRIYY